MYVSGERYLLIFSCKANLVFIIKKKKVAVISKDDSKTCGLADVARRELYWNLWRGIVALPDRIIYQQTIFRNSCCRRVDTYQCIEMLLSYDDTVIISGSLVKS